MAILGPFELQGVLLLVQGIGAEECWADGYPGIQLYYYCTLFYYDVTIEWAIGIGIWPDAMRVILISVSFLFVRSRALRSVPIID